MSIDSTISQRRALVDRMTETCLEEVGSLAYNERLPISKKMAMLDSVVHICLSTLPSMFMPLAKHPFAIRLFLAMIEELYSENTGVPLPHDYSKIMSARTELTDCLRKLAMSLILGKFTVARAPKFEKDKELDELATVESMAIERVRRGEEVVMYSADQVREIARSVDGLITNALRSIDLVDAEIMIEEAIEKLNVLLTDKDLRKYVAGVIGEDPVKCLNDHVRKYEEVKQGDVRVTASASWVGRLYEDYQRCVQFSQDQPPCSEMRYIQEREVCARSKCAMWLITLLPGVLERLGVTTIVSQVVTR